MDEDGSQFILKPSKPQTVTGFTLQELQEVFELSSALNSRGRHHTVKHHVTDETIKTHPVVLPGILWDCPFYQLEQNKWLES